MPPIRPRWPHRSRRPAAPGSTSSISTARSGARPGISWRSAAIVAGPGLRVQFGGGLRTREAVENALGLGVSRVVIGTRAAESESFVGDLVQSFRGQDSGRHRRQERPRGR